MSRDEGIRLSDSARSLLSNGADKEEIDVARWTKDAESSGYISLLLIDEVEIFETSEGRDEFIEDIEEVGVVFIEERR
jgi:hypothetical protein